MTISMNKQVQVSVEDLLDTLNAVQEDNVKTSTGIASRPAKETDNDGGVLSFFRDMFANSQAKAAEAREAIQPEMYRLAQESAYEVSEARKLAGITQSLTEGGGEIGRKPLPEGTTLRPVAKPPMTSMRDVTDTDEGKLDNEQPLRDLSDAVTNEQIPSTQLEPTAKDEADEVVNSLVEQLTTARLSAGEVTEEAAPVTAEAETTNEGLMARPKAKPRNGLARVGEDAWLGGALDTVLESEGGFQNDKEDSGNYRPDGTLIGTNKGITPNALAAYKGVDANTITVEDIKGVDDATARDIYKQNYYEAPGIDKLPADLKETVMDMYINAGSNAIKILQRKVGADVDGVLGPNTIQAVIDSDLTKDDYADARIEYYTNLANKKPKLKKYLKGWKARANKYRG